MKTFKCTCGQTTYFDNTSCEACQAKLAYAPDLGVLAPYDEVEGGAVVLRGFEGQRYRHCQHRGEYEACNWLVPARDPSPSCASCRLNQVVPNLSTENNLALWRTFEAGKRHLLFELRQLGLPVRSKLEDPSGGLAFKLMEATPENPVTTGHAEGLITINLAEIDPVQREQARVRLQERYRTPLGHLRHEVGHYYWDALVRDSKFLEPCRALFGDEQIDYAEALRNHYAGEPSAGWSDTFISDYASAHPWEDWAETWAHYLHMLDTLETAQDFGLVKTSVPLRSQTKPKQTDELLDLWSKLTLALNALNRSMGLKDAYPFVVAPKVREKIAFVADVVRSSAVKPSEPARKPASSEKPSRLPGLRWLSSRP